MRKRIRTALDHADARVERWPLDPVTFPDVAENLRHGYRAGAPRDTRELAGCHAARVARTAYARGGAPLSDGDRRAAMAAARAKLGPGGATAAHAARSAQRFERARALRRAAWPAGALAFAAAIGDRPAPGTARGCRARASPPGCSPKNRRRSAIAWKRYGAAPQTAASEWWRSARNARIQSRRSSRRDAAAGTVRRSGTTG